MTYVARNGVNTNNIFDKIKMYITGRTERTGGTGGTLQNR